VTERGVLALPSGDLEAGTCQDMERCLSLGHGARDTGGGTSQDIERKRQASGTHPLETADLSGGTCWDIERVQLSKRLVSNLTCVT